MQKKLLQICLQLLLHNIKMKEKANVGFVDELEEISPFRSAQNLTVMLQGGMQIFSSLGVQS